MHELLIENLEITDLNANEEEQEEEHNATLLVNSTAAKDLKLGDIKKLLSAPPKTAIKQPRKKADFSSEIIINEKTRYEAGTHVTHHI